MQDLTTPILYGDYVNIDIGIIHNINSLLTNDTTPWALRHFIADDGGEIHVGCSEAPFHKWNRRTAYLVNRVCPYYDKLEMTSQGIVNIPPATTMMNARLLPGHGGA